jgi:hypothetical protein
VWILKTGKGDGVLRNLQKKIIVAVSLYFKGKV